MYRDYLVKLGSRTFTIFASSFDNVIGHVYDYPISFGIKNSIGERIGKPHIKVA